MYSLLKHTTNATAVHGLGPPRARRLGTRGPSKTGQFLGAVPVVQPARLGASSHVDELVDALLVPAHVLVLNEPLDLLLDHLLGRQKHVLQDLHQLGLQLRIGYPLAHFHDLHNGLLRAWICKEMRCRIKLSWLVQLLTQFP